MNPTPFTVTDDTPLPRVFNLYRSLGLRHVPVLRGEDIIGIITRKELTQHRLHDLDQQFHAMAQGQAKATGSGDGVEILDEELGPAEHYFGRGVQEAEEQASAGPTEGSRSPTPQRMERSETVTSESRM